MSLVRKIGNTSSKMLTEVFHEQRQEVAELFQVQGKSGPV